MKKALVLGAGGFIGHHMVKRLKSDGYWVRGVDVKYPEFEPTEADSFCRLDLTEYYNIVNSLGEEFDEIYQFAADMGGASYIFSGDHDANLMTNSSLINLNLCKHLADIGFRGKVFYSSSACMYPQELQARDDSFRGDMWDRGLRESDAYPANPDSEYGWEKLFSERLYLAYQRNHGLNVRIARFHNVYGPMGTYKGGREKAPAAMCRKVAELDVEKVAHIDVLGDGKQTRSFLYIDDCIDAIRLLMQSEHKEPINIGSEEMVSINQLAGLVRDISGKRGLIRNVASTAIGVRGRNSDNTVIRKALSWEPKYSLKHGLEITYRWVEAQVNR